MATKTINSKIKIRSDITYNWNRQNPVLDTGEFAYNTQTGEIKIGNGTNRFTYLPNIVSEALLSWGGKNQYATFSPIDASLVDVLGANRFAFIYSKAVEVYYSRDAGQTWIDYEATDDEIYGLSIPVVTTFLSIGKCQRGEAPTKDWMLRVVINTRNDTYGDTSEHNGLYSNLNKFIININTNYSTNCKVTIDARLETNRRDDIDTWTVFADNVDIAGWSGYNVINTATLTTYGNTPTSQYGQIRFTFSHGNDVPASEYNKRGFSLINIYAYGGMGWYSPSTMAKKGTIYDINSNKTVTFPGVVRATSFMEGDVQLGYKYAQIPSTGKLLALDDERHLHLQNTYGTNLSSLTFPLATTSLDGWMSSTDKSRCDVAYTHSQSAHAPSNAQKNSDITKEEIQAKLTGSITTHSHPKLHYNYTVTGEQGDTTAVLKVNTNHRVELDITGPSTDGKTISNELAFKTEIPTIPTALKNPNALTLQIRGATTSTTTYDGSVARNVIITDQNVSQFVGRPGGEEGATYPLLFSPMNTMSSSSTTTSVYRDNSIFVDPSSHSLTANSLISMGNVYAAGLLRGGLEILTTRPTSNNTNGIKFVILNSATYPVSSTTKYSGYIYMWY